MFSNGIKWLSVKSNRQQISGFNFVCLF
jgi:hypothetical protein